MVNAPLQIVMNMSTPSSVLRSALFLWILGLCYDVTAQISFAQPVAIAPNLVEVARPHVSDIDGDGELDVVLSSTGKGRVVAFELERDTLLTPRELLSGVIDRNFCKLNDINGDGYDDLITGRADEYPAASQPVLYLNNGDGTYGSPILISGGSAYYDWQILAADLTGDGVSEIIHLYGHYVRVWRYDQTTEALELFGSFEASEDWKGAAAADLNNDGVNELILAKWYWIGYWDPASVGSLLVTIDQGTGLPWRFIPADIDQDGRIDLFTYTGITTTIGSYTTYMQQADGTFVVGNDQWVGSYLTDPQLLDSNNDGEMELWGSDGTSLISLVLSSNGEIASTNTVLVSSTRIVRFVVGDIVGDGNKDLIAITEDDRLLQWEGSAGPTFISPPFELFAWPHDMVSKQSAWSQPTSEAESLIIASGSSLYYSLPGCSTRASFFTAELSGLGRPVDIPLTPHCWNGYRRPGTTVVDIDHDGDLDVLGYHSFGSGSPCVIYFLEYDHSTGQFTERCIGNDIDQSSTPYITRTRSFDVNGDGLEDVIVKGYRIINSTPPNPQYQISFDIFLLQLSPGVFEEGTWPFSSNWLNVDLDNDGSEDIVYYESGSLKVLRNLGSGQFVETASAPTFDAAYGTLGDPYADTDFDGYGGDEIGTGFIDANADGILDLIRTVRSAGEYKLYFQPITIDVIGEPRLLYEQPLGVNGKTFTLFSDLDLDGDDDLLVFDNPSAYDFTGKVVKNNLQFPLVEDLLLYSGNNKFEPVLFDEDGDGDKDLSLRLGPCLLSMRNKSVHPLISSGSFSIYPNPTSGDIIIDLGLDGPLTAQIEVFDAIGRSVIDRTVMTTVVSVNLSDLPSGLYFVRARLTDPGQLVRTERLLVVTSQ